MKDKWIQDAFNNAQFKVGGMTIEEFSDHIDECIMKHFPFVMSAFDDAYGQDKALAMAMLVFKDRTVFNLIRAFFTAGYKCRLDEEEKKEGGQDNG